MANEAGDNGADEVDNGVLPEAGADTTGIGIVAGGTAQVDVALPVVAPDDDDLVEDDDVVLDEADDGALSRVIPAPAERSPPAAAERVDTRVRSPRPWRRSPTRTAMSASARAPPRSRRSPAYSGDFEADRER
ncbi:MAG: hypothetical protein U0Q04_05790 [Microbacterium sp.]